MTWSAGFTAGWVAQAAGRSGHAVAAASRHGPTLIAGNRDGADQQRGTAIDTHPLRTGLVGAIRAAPGQVVVRGEYAAPAAIRTVPDDLGHRNLLSVPLR